MTTDKPYPGRLELHVGDEQTRIVGLPDERVRVVWDDYAGGGEKKSDRHLIGTVVLAILLGLALVATTRTPTLLRRIG